MSLDHLNRPYARAREPENDDDAHRMTVFASMSPEQWPGATRALRRAVNRVRWREMVARRCAALARALRVVEAHLGSRFAARTKRDEGWIIVARDRDVDVEVCAIHAPRLRTFKELGGPLKITIFRVDILNPEILQVRLNQSPRSHDRKRE